MMHPSSAEVLVVLPATSVVMKAHCAPFPPGLYLQDSSLALLVGAYHLVLRIQCLAVCWGHCGCKIGASLGLVSRLSKRYTAARHPSSGLASNVISDLTV